MLYNTFRYTFLCTYVVYLFQSKIKTLQLFFTPIEMEENSLIYGLELQARALTPQYGESNDVCFFIATNSLKPTNQVHLIQYEEEQGTVQSKVRICNSQRIY